MNRLGIGAVSSLVVAGVVFCGVAGEKPTRENSRAIAVASVGSVAPMESQDVPMLLAAGTTTAAPAKAAAAPAATPAKGKNDTLIIVARVSEIPGTFPPNDLYNYVYIMKYRIVKVVKGSYEGKEILVGHYNPLIARANIKDKMDKFVDGDVQKFEVGAKHKLVLVVPIGKVWTEAIEDEYFDSEMPKYYALRADMSAE